MSYGFLTNAQNHLRGNQASPAPRIAFSVTHPSLKLHPTAADRSTVRQLLDQISVTLTTLSNAASELLYGQPETQLVERLQVQARQAEAAMHRLLELDNISSELTMALSQHVTVLILLADMLADGLTAGMTPTEWEVLTDRNLQQAHSYMAQL